MNKPWRIILPLLIAAAVAALLLTSAPPVKLVPAPPGPAELGSATGLSTPAQGAIVFDLKYLVQTGSPGDIQYRSYWGYGGSSDEQRTNAFLQDVRKQAKGSLHYVYGYPFSDRKWAAVEYHGRQATTLFFDLNGNGKLDENERMAPSRKVSQGYEFITPDFINPLEGGGQTLCRAVLQVNFYKGNSEPNSMWSPAALLEATTTVEGQPVRLLLYANSPGGRFDKFGSSSYSLLSGDQGKVTAEQYIPRERLSSLITGEGLPSSGAASAFYRVMLEGRRTNGLPARVVLVKDNSTTGALAVRLASSNAIQAAITSLNLYGVDDQTVFFRVGNRKDKLTLPVGTYSVEDGYATYGTAEARDWDVWFSGGPRATIKSGEVCEVALGEPMLKVRAIDERERYNSRPSEGTRFKQGTQIYLQPSITGKNREKYTRFQARNVAKGERADRPPKVTITGADGKQVFSATMEYG